MKIWICFGNICACRSIESEKVCLRVGEALSGSGIAGWSTHG